MFEKALKDFIEQRIKQEASDTVETMIRDYSDKLRANSAKLVSEIALSVMKEMSMERMGTELVITVRLPEAKV
jgi:homoserine kinase